MTDINYSELLDYALRAQSAYVLSGMSFALTEYMGWKTSQRQISICEVPNSKVNVILEIDPQNHCQWIAVRGTNNLRNWQLNLLLSQRQCDETDRTMPCAGTDLHRGFREAATEVFEAIRPYLHPELPIRLTGHSLGGAIAAILMLFLREQNFDVEKCVTFGQPKITDHLGAIANSYMPLIRVVHDEDIVPQLPPKTPLAILEGGYEHFGTELLLHDSELFDHHQLSEPMSKASRDSFWLKVCKTVFQTDIHRIHESIEDHGLGHYILSLLHELRVQKQLQADHLPLMKAFAIATHQRHLQPQRTLAEAA